MQAATIILIFTAGMTLGFFLAAALHAGSREDAAPSEMEIGESIENGLRHLR